VNSVETFWPEVQDSVRRCIRCRTDLPRIRVVCPPGVLYPPGIEPPEPVRVLFVGVAPPESGRHFYTDPSDNLRRGLFDILRELRRPCGSLSDFIDRGFFLVHTAKCAIRDTTKPSLPVSKLCASTHLYREIECLAPDGLCFLSKNIGFPVASDLLARWGARGPLPFGELISIVVGRKTIQAIATTWPGREVHKPVAMGHVDSVFSALNLPTWQ
jgi:hypothetical protein